MSAELDVVVIGAGLSGLVCARRLVEAGLRVCVVEARDRIGGRIHSVPLGDQVVDLGAHLMTATQDRLAALAAELGVESAPAERTGRAKIAPGGLIGAFAQLRAIRRIERMIRESESSSEDHKSLADHLGTIRNSVARERLALHAQLILAAEPADISLLAYLRRLEATGGFAPRGPELPGGGRERYFPAGAQELTTRLADGLEIRFSSPVVAIEQQGERMCAVIDGGSECIAMPDGSFAERATRDSLTAKRVVLAIPPALVRTIAVDLPPDARAFVDRVHTGGVVKIFLAYERAFWRDAGLSGECYRPTGTVRATIATGATLVAFVVGKDAARWASRDPAERRREVIDTVVGELGESAREIVNYREADWAADPWSAGCVACTPPGALAAGAAWRGPYGRLHIAGTESASVWTGYMDGAIEAGERAAREVIEGLRAVAVIA